MTMGFIMHLGASTALPAAEIGCATSHRAGRDRLHDTETAKTARCTHRCPVQRSQRLGSVIHDAAGTASCSPWHQGRWKMSQKPDARGCRWLPC